MPVVHSSASALSTRGVFTGHGPSSNVSTTSLSVRKSSCLKCWKPKAGPRVVSISTTRLTPSASGLAQVFLGCGATGAFSGIAAVTSTSSRFGADLAVAVAGSVSAGRTATLWGAATSARGESVQNHTPAMTTAVTTLANIRPNALRIVALPQKPAPALKPLMRRGLNALPTRPCSATNCASDGVAGARFGLVTDITVGGLSDGHHSSDQAAHALMDINNAPRPASNRVAENDRIFHQDYSPGRFGAGFRRLFLRAGVELKLRLQRRGAAN